MSSKVTLKQISEIADVSIATVSRVINGYVGVSSEIRERVLHVIDETGYQPNPAARSLAGWKSRIIGLIIPEPTSNLFIDPYFSHLIPSISEACKANDYTLSLFLFHTIEEESKLISRVLSRQLIDGVIVSGTHYDDPMIRQLMEAEMPFVLIGSHESKHVSYVDVDNVAGAYMATDHLLNLGYERVATITGPTINYAAVQRKQGYLNALKRHRQPYNASLVAEGDFTEAGGYQAALTLLGQQPDAIFVASDRMAAGVLRALSDHNLKVPTDIAVIGFDDFPTTMERTPNLTTIRQPIGRTGTLAVEMLLDMLEHETKETRRLILPTELVIRDSCAYSRYQVKAVVG